MGRYEEMLLLIWINCFLFKILISQPSSETKIILKKKEAVVNSMHQLMKIHIKDSVPNSVYISFGFTELIGYYMLKAIGGGLRSNFHKLGLFERTNF